MNGVGAQQQAPSNGSAAIIGAHGPASTVTARAAAIISVRLAAASCCCWRAMATTIVPWSKMLTPVRWPQRSVVQLANCAPPANVGRPAGMLCARSRSLER